LSARIIVMKKWATILLALAILGISYSVRQRKLGGGQRDQSRSFPQAEPAVASAPDTALTLMPTAAGAARLNSPETGAGEDVVIVGTLVHHYRRVFEQNPVGLNHEIVRSLAGGNTKRAAFLSPEHPAISDRGELLDRWGTAFFFHQISGTEMEVISAGPDREMWTADDVTSG
jgi:hypothetical protein